MSNDAPIDNTPAIVSSFKSDVLDDLGTASAVDPGKFGAINWRVFLDKLDNSIQQVAPIIETLSPPQYAAVVKLIAGAVHSFHGGDVPTSPAPG